ITSAVAISAALWIGAPGISQYRGLSGIDSALFVLAALMLLNQLRQTERRLGASLVVAGLIGFVAKVGFEFATGITLFVDSSAAAFQPLPSVHLVGGLVGLAICFLGQPAGRAY